MARHGTEVEEPDVTEGQEDEESESDEIQVPTARPLEFDGSKTLKPTGSRV